MIYAVVLAASMGQVCYEPVYTDAVCVPYTTPIFVAPTDYVYIRLGGMNEEQRFYDTIQYGSVWRKVPVINGYAPDVNECQLSTGGRRIVYDYCRRTRYEDCLTVRQREREPVRPPRKAPSRRAPREELPEEELDSNRRRDLVPVIPMPIDEDAEEPPVRRRTPERSVPSDMKRPSDVVDPERVLSPDYERRQ